MGRLFQLFAYLSLTALGILYIVHDGEIIWCIRCGYAIPNLLSLVSIGIGIAGVIGTLTTKSKSVDAKGY